MQKGKFRKNFNRVGTKKEKLWIRTTTILCLFSRKTAKTTCSPIVEQTTGGSFRNFLPNGTDRRKSATANRQAYFTVKKTSIGLSRSYFRKAQDSLKSKMETMISFMNQSPPSTRKRITILLHKAATAKNAYSKKYSNR